MLKFLSIVNLIVCAEILEHLASPGRLLKQLRYYRCPVVLSVPNAFSEVGFAHLRKGFENCNIQHVSYYSYRTLKTLVERFDYTIDSFWWYTGIPLFSEGLVMVVR